jgi:hypothetical protein
VRRGRGQYPASTVPNQIVYKPPLYGLLAAWHILYENIHSLHTKCVSTLAIRTGKGVVDLYRVDRPAVVLRILHATLYLIRTFYATRNGFKGIEDVTSMLMERRSNFLGGKDVA